MDSSATVHVVLDTTPSSDGTGLGNLGDLEQSHHGCFIICFIICSLGLRRALERQRLGVWDLLLEACSREETIGG
ncbi:hypothetical protein ACOMHN_004999 [Nucella lapillus]